MPEREPHFEEETVKSEIREISPEFLEKVENSPLVPEDKAFLILTKAGLKPCTLIQEYVKFDGVDWLGEEKAKVIESLVKESGLFFDIKRKRELEKYQDLKKGEIIQDEEKIEVLASNSEEILSRVKEVISKMPTQAEAQAGKYNKKELRRNQKELGSILGYPATAVEAFVGDRKILDKKSLPAEVKESDALAFSAFMLSKNNWQQELEQGKIWADYIKSVSPKIYQEVMEMNREIWRDNEQESSAQI